MESGNYNRQNRFNVGAILTVQNKIIEIFLIDENLIIHILFALFKWTLNLCLLGYLIRSTNQQINSYV